MGREEHSDTNLQKQFLSEGSVYFCEATTTSTLKIQLLSLKGTHTKHIIEEKRECKINRHVK